MNWSDIPWAPAPRVLRQFAGLWLLFFGSLAGWHGVYHGQVSLGVGLGIAAGAVGVPGLVAPGLVRPIFVGWLVATFPVGWLVSRLLLAVLYHGMFTPLGLIFRAAGRDPLRLRRPDLPTYWTTKPAVADPRRYYQQF